VRQEYYYFPRSVHLVTFGKIGTQIHSEPAYNHVHCQTYIKKIVSHHGWDKLKIRSPPTPMKSDLKYQEDIQTSRGPESLKEQKELERRMGFSYRQTIGE
jgi:hypothetical protein